MKIVPETRNSPFPPLSMVSPPTSPPASLISFAPDGNEPSPISAVDSPTQEAHQTPPRRTSASPSPLGPNVIQLQHVAAAKLAGKSNVPTTATGKHLPSTTPPINVFSNDGSFLERFKKMKQDEDERLKREEAMRRKKEFEERIKSRGKRKKAVTDASEEGADEVEEGDEHHPKRAKEANDDEPMDPKASAYLKEMQTYNERHVGDERRSRPLVK